MTNLLKASEEFNLKLEKLLFGCEAVEETGVWDKENLGEMDAFYSNEIVTVIIRLMACDGNFQKGEIDFLNDSFGFTYEREELEDIYFKAKGNIQSVFNEGIDAGYKRLEKINKKLAGAYKELVLLACQIIASSDGEIQNVENELIDQLKSDLDD